MATVAMAMVMGGGYGVDDLGGSVVAWGCYGGGVGGGMRGGGVRGEEV